MIHEYVKALKNVSTKRLRSLIDGQTYEIKEPEQNEKIEKYLKLINELEEVKALENELMNTNLKEAINTRKGETWEKLKQRKKLWNKIICKAIVIDKLYAIYKDELAKILFDLELPKEIKNKNLLNAIGYFIEEEENEKRIIKKDVEIVSNSECLFLLKEDAKALEEALKRFEKVKVEIQIMNAKIQVYKDKETEEKFRDIQKEYLDLERKITELKAKRIYAININKNVKNNEEGKE